MNSLGGVWRMGLYWEVVFNKKKKSKITGEHAARSKARVYQKLN